jgi:LysR family cys regulon transcriptional activator
MNLRQLRFISEVARRGLNVSAAADALYTSQPGVSKQIRLLEDELGVRIFERRGKQLTRITEAGRTIIEYANRALVEVEAVADAAQAFRDPARGSLSIATKHTQAKHRLPPLIAEFRATYPQIALHMHSGTPVQIADMVTGGEADFAIVTEAMEHFDELVTMPCYHWHRAVVVPRGHALCGEENLTLKALAGFPLLTYSSHAVLDAAFRAHQLTPNVVLTATDADVIKTYVRLGLGVGIVARIAFDEQADPDLCALDASRLFTLSTTSIAMRRDAYMREYMYAFIELFAPHLTRDVVDTVLQTRSKGALRSLFIDTQIPDY